MRQGAVAAIGYGEASRIAGGSWWTPFDAAHVFVFGILTVRHDAGAVQCKRRGPNTECVALEYTGRGHRYMCDAHTDRVEGAARIVRRACVARAAGWGRLADPHDLVWCGRVIQYRAQRGVFEILAGVRVAETSHVGLSSGPCVTLCVDPRSSLHCGVGWCAGRRRRRRSCMPCASWLQQLSFIDTRWLQRSVWLDVEMRANARWLRSSDSCSCCAARFT